MLNWYQTQKPDLSLENYNEEVEPRVKFESDLAQALEELDKFSNHRMEMGPYPYKLTQE